MAARIRSMHPGLFTDEAFVSCPPLARILLLGIWTEADDRGVFEWKPMTLKMRLLPADISDVAKLLGDLAACDIVKKVTINGKTYGLVRNFCRFQRPKKPIYRIELPERYWGYVGLNAAGFHPNPTRSPHKSESGTVPVPNLSDIAPGKAAQMEEGGGRGKDGGDSNQIDKPVVVVVPPDPEASAGTTTTQVLEGIGLQRMPVEAPSNLLGTALPETWVPDDGCIAVAHDHGMTDAAMDGKVLRFDALNAQPGTFWQDAAGFHPNPTRSPHKSESGTVPVPNLSDTAPGKAAQMEEGGGRGKDGGDSNQIDKPVVVVVPPDPEASAGTTTTKAVEGFDLQTMSVKATANPLGTAVPATWGATP
jgi:hypothetical protein